MAVFKLRNVFLAMLPISIHFGQIFAQQGCPDIEYAVDQSYNYGNLAGGLPSLEYSSPYPIVGAPLVDESSPVPVRQEIRELEKNTDLWTLFILGLDKLQSVDQQDPLSWYQIGGIHGRPYIPWDKVAAKPGSEDAGYCTHHSVLFVPWHRPYLALYEQVLYQHIQGIAKLYPEGAVRDRYVNAAKSFRIPYWDWAAPQTGNVIADSITAITLDVAGPNGKQTISNPLYSYRFHPLIPEDIAIDPFINYNRTMRFPTVPDSSATSCMWRTRRAFNANQKAFQSGVYQLLTNARYKNYTVFSNEGHWNVGDSLETEHDDPHALLGGSNGTMFPIELSGFEPGFWLHHAMVDRLYSLWAILNPDSYVEPEPADEKTFTTAVGDIEDGNSPLTPFHADNEGTLWTANTARYTKTFNYAYPETVKLAGETDADVLSKVTAAINALYGPKAAPPPVKLRRYPGVARRGPPSILSSRATAPNTTATYRDYTSSLTFPQSSLPGPYIIYLFLGSVNESDISNWLFSNNLVGTNAIFAHFEMDREVSDKPLTKTLPLSDSLKKAVNAGKLRSLEIDEVTPYLKANLKYRFSLQDEKVDITSVKDLTAEVVSSVVTPGKDSTELPGWGPEEQVLKVDLSA